MKKVIFIIGSGRSGSTVLGKSLGSHPKGIFVGELDDLKEQMVNNAHCSCEKYYQKCEFWTQIFHMYSHKLNRRYDFLWPNLNFKFNEKTLIKKLRIFFLIIYSKIMNCRYNDNDNTKIIRDTIRIYERVFEKTKKEFIVDSGKNVFRALILQSHLKNYNSVFIYLVRDGRSVLNSTQKKNVELNWEGKKLKLTNPNTIAPSIAINRWIIQNLRIILLWSFLGKKKIRLKHETFCKSPMSTLEMISKVIGINFDEKMLILDNKIHHIIGGNASRINAKRINKTEEAWQNSLNPDLKRKFKNTAKLFNKLIGY